MKLATARDFLRLFHMVGRAPFNYRRLIICSPYVSPELLTLLLTPNLRVKVPALVITNTDTIGALPNNAFSGCFALEVVKNLHAKAYVACGTDVRNSIAIIGSFKLTKAAIATNLEIGVWLQGRSQAERQLIELLENILTKMAHHGPRERVL
jgi:hypothetical protein